MKRVAIVFVAAVLAPSLALAGLAMRSLRDQQFLIERQQLLLYQGVAESVAKDVSGFIAERQREFRRQVEGMIASDSPLEVASEFDERLRQTWPLAEVGFAVSLEGSMLSPSLFGRPEARNFRLQNDRFLCNRESVQVYWNRPASSSPLYPAGFAINFGAFGSLYVRPMATGQPMLDLPRGQLDFDRGDLTHAYTNGVAFGPGSHVTNLGPHTLQLSLKTANGLIQGTLAATGLTQRITFRGAVQQKTTNGFGFFLGTNQSGRVHLEPERDP